MSKSKTSAPLLNLTGVTKQYGLGEALQHAIEDINLSIDKGEFIIIMGPSGCGKTTLLNIIGLLDRPDSGEFLFNDTPIAYASDRKRAKLRSSEIGIVFQGFNLIQRLNVLENVALPLSYQGYGRIKRLEKASKTLKTFHLQNREYYMPWQLSGGQMQRVAIARALAGEPTLILADEPTGNLDSRSSHVIMEELAELHRKGNTIIMVTHNPDLTSYATRVISMIDGKIDKDSKTSNQQHKKSTTVKRPLGSAKKSPKAKLKAKVKAKPKTKPKSKKAVKK